MGIIRSPFAMLDCQAARVFQVDILGVLPTWGRDGLDSRGNVLFSWQVGMGGNVGVVSFCLWLDSLLSCSRDAFDASSPEVLRVVERRKIMRNTGMRQNGGVESLRLLLMFGITFLHQLGEFGVGGTFLGRACNVCVVGFVFISGWYGIKFSVVKLVRLYGLGLFAAILTAIVLKFPGGEGVIACASKFLGYFWFLHAYAVLMCLSPILNLAFSDDVSEAARRRILVPVLVLVFGYCFLAALPVLRDWMPQFAGNSVHGFLTLVGIYVTAKWGRVLAVDRVSAKWCAGIALLCLVPCGLGFGKYNSPFALVLAGALFLLLYKLNMSERVGETFAFLGRSMFSVYLLQIGFVGLLLPSKIKMLGFFGYTGAFVSASSVFLACLGVDLARRVFVCILKLSLSAQRLK